MLSVGASPHGLRLAARAIARGQVVAYPTEAVYGLGCDPRNGAAVGRLLDIKGRDENKGLILIAADFAALAPYVEPLPAAAMAEIRAGWPGPGTWLLPAAHRTPRWLTGRYATLAVRVTAHPVAARLCHAWGGALVSTSANLADQTPERTALRVRRQLGAALDLIVAGPCGGARRPSTIRDGRTGCILRH